MVYPKDTAVRGAVTHGHGFRPAAPSPFAAPCAPREGQGRGQRCGVVSQLRLVVGPGTRPRQWRAHTRTGRCDLRLPCPLCTLPGGLTQARSLRLSPSTARAARAGLSSTDRPVLQRCLKQFGRAASRPAAPASLPRVGALTTAVAALPVFVCGLQTSARVHLAQTAPKLGGLQSSLLVPRETRAAAFGGHPVLAAGQGHPVSGDGWSQITFWGLQQHWRPSISTSTKSETNESILLISV